MKSQTITIAAAAGGQSGVIAAHVTGKYFLVTAINGLARVSTSYGDEYDLSESGDGFGGADSPQFGKLTFYNDGGVAVTITFYASNTPIKTPDVTVQSS